MPENDMHAENANRSAPSPTGEEALLGWHCTWDQMAEDYGFLELNDRFYSLCHSS